MLAFPISTTASGIRPVNLRRDMPQVMKLLNLVFRPVLDSDGRRILDRNLGLASPGWLWMYPFQQVARGPAPGFVWEENGKIVGNITLLTTKLPGRFLVANVAVHPDFRRRGIARQLMEAVENVVAQRGGNKILLQVAHDNASALALYDRLGYENIGAITQWDCLHSRIRALPIATSNRGPDRLGHYFLRPLRRGEWQEAWQLDKVCFAPDWNWPEPIRPDAYRQTFFRWVGQFLNGQQHEMWAIKDERIGKLVGVGTISSEWGRAHELRLRIDPAGSSDATRPLLAKLLRRLRYLARRRVKIEHPAGDEQTNRLLKEANFSPRRTLTVMRHKIQRN